MARTKKDLTPVEYSKEEILNYAKQMVQAAHKILEEQERKYGRQLYETFGQWKKEHPTYPIAKKNYPDEEYVQVIASYKNYFDAIAVSAKEATTAIEYDF